MDSSANTSPEPTSHPCPSVEALKVFLSGGLSEDDRERLSQHVSSCSKCISLISTLPSREATFSQQGVVLEFGDEASAGELNSDESTVSERAPTLQPTMTYMATAGIGRLLGRYQLMQPLGKGGFGIVYLAIDTKLKRSVAIKVPFTEKATTDTHLKMYRAEAEVLATLDHANIVPIYDIGETTDVPIYMVSKYIQGQDLAAKLKSAPLFLRDTVQIVARLADALVYVHRLGIIHRDIKPKNILLDLSGTPYLADFGLARLVELSSGKNGRRRVVGTPGYMAPEQSTGHPCDQRTDIFSLGVVLFEMITGVRYQTAIQGHETTVSSSDADPVSAQISRSRLPRDLDAIVRKATATDPAKRYQEASELLADLRGYLRGEPAYHAREVSWRERLASTLHKKSVVLALSAAALVGFVAAGYFGLNATPLAPVIKHRVAIPTDPPGAELFIVPMDKTTGKFKPEKGLKTLAAKSVFLEPGYHWVTAVMPDDPNRFHEVIRVVPRELGGLQDAFWINNYEVVDDIITLPKITILPGVETETMARFSGAEPFAMGDPKNPFQPVETVNMPSFFLDTREVTIKEYGQTGLKPRYPRNYKKRFPDDHPIRFICWEEAVMWAEKNGKRLPEAAEFEFAATNGGKQKFPWEKESPKAEGWPMLPAGNPSYDCVQLPGQPPVFGLYSNVAEWTMTPSKRPQLNFRQEPPMEVEKIPTFFRLVYGAPSAVIENEEEFPNSQYFNAREAVAIARPLYYPGLGFRCARSTKARMSAADFLRPIAAPK